jgi:hypothetical protein
MRRSAHDLEFLEHLPAERVAGQHALDRLLEHLFRRPREQLLERLGLQVTYVKPVCR